MSIKILGGLAKGLSLTTLSEKELRPTSVILRRKLFDAHQDLGGHLFVDLFAGTGAMGIEAWSRGANKVILVEKHKKTASQIQRNLKVLQQQYSTLPISLAKEDALKWLKVHCSELVLSLKEELETSQLEGIIFFLDPPYEKISLYEGVLESLSSSLLEQATVAAATQIWLEGDQQKGRKREQWQENLKDSWGGVKWSEVKSYKQGSHFMMILRPEEGSF